MSELRSERWALLVKRLIGTRGTRARERTRAADVRAALELLQRAPMRLHASAPSASSSSRPIAPLPPSPAATSPAPAAQAEPVITEHQYTFVRAIAQRPGHLYLTWDVNADVPRGSAHLLVRWQSFLGDPPDASEFSNPDAMQVPVALTDHGVMVQVPVDRLAVVATLVVDGVARATSNVTLMPPDAPAPPGPLWQVTLAPNVDRRQLRGHRLLAGEIAAAQLQTLGDITSDGISALSQHESAGSPRWRR